MTDGTVPEATRLSEHEHVYAIIRLDAVNEPQCSDRLVRISRDRLQQVLGVQE